MLICLLISGGVGGSNESTDEWSEVETEEEEEREYARVAEEVDERKECVCVRGEEGRREGRYGETGAGEEDEEEAEREAEGAEEEDTPSAYTALRCVRVRACVDTDTVLSLPLLSANDTESTYRGTLSLTECREESDGEETEALMCRAVDWRAV